MSKSSKLLILFLLLILLALLFASPVVADNNTTQIQYSTPHQVRIKYIDNNGNPIPNLLITITPTGSASVPWAWIWQVLGYNESIGIGTQSMNGTTDIDGAIAAIMVEDVQYTINAVSASLGINHTWTIFPKDSDYIVRVPISSAGPLLISRPYYNVTITDLDTASATLGVNFTDLSVSTTGLTFYVYNSTGLLYSHAMTMDANGYANETYSVTNTKGDYYRWGVYGTHPQAGIVQGWRDGTLPGLTTLFTFGLNELERQIVAVATIFLIAAIFGSSSNRFGVFVVPFIGAGFWWYVGWLPPATIGVITLCCFIGGLIYARTREGEMLKQ